MTPERWQRIQQVFHAAVACDEATRDSVLDAETSGDVELRREVEKMLRHAFISGPLDQPAWDGSPLQEAPPLGTRLGPYELVEEAGAGGMGRVYKARDTRLGRVVAVKVLSAEFSHRYQAEARAISALNHPHICALYDIGEQDGIAYLVMEYVEGESLAAHLRYGPLPIAEVLLYGSQIAAALAAAHRLGIVHRDLKPANVMITESGAKVLDFGVSQMMDGDAESSSGTPFGVMGTVAYMSPSQLNGNPPDIRSDIFSLGLVLQEMASGPRAQARRASLSSIPPALGGLIDRCLDEDAARRPQSMDEVRFALERMRSAVPAAGLRRVHAAWMTALVATVAAGGLLFWKATHSEAPRAPVTAVMAQSNPETAAAPTGGSSATAPVERRRPVEAVDPTPPVRPAASTPAALPISQSFLTTYPGYVRDPRFSPDGKMLAFSWATPGKTGYGIYVRGLSPEDEPRNLTDGSSQDYGPAWSPDGRTIAFRRGGSHSAIYLVPVSGEQPHLLAPIAHQNYETLPQMSWSPDGKWIAAPDRESDGSTNLYLFSTGTGDRRRLTSNTEGTDHAPAFSPDGKLLAFASCASGVVQCDVKVMTLGKRYGDIGLPRQVTDQRSFIRGVTWSSDGRSLVYAAGISRGGNQPTSLWRISLNPPGMPERIDLGGSAARHPALSPSGDMLAYTRFDPGNWHLMLISHFR